MAPRIVWDAGTPAEIVTFVDPLLREFIDAVPGWCYELRCGYDSSDNTGSAWTRVNVEYRWTRFMVCGKFLEWDAARRRDTVLHELVHIQLQPLADVVQEMIEAMEAMPEPVRIWAKERRRMAMEGATCDLTEAILRLMSRPAA